MKSLKFALKKINLRHQHVHFSEWKIKPILILLKDLQFSNQLLNNKSAGTVHTTVIRSARSAAVRCKICRLQGRPITKYELQYHFFPI